MSKPTPKRKPSGLHVHNPVEVDFPSFKSEAEEAD